MLDPVFTAWDKSILLLGVMFLGQGAGERASWQVLLVRDFLRGLYLSRSRAGDGQNKIG